MSWHCDSRGLGIASPGVLDFDKGEVVVAANLPGWKNVPLVARIKQATGWSCVLENDARAAVAAECWVGAGRDPSIHTLAILTLGTGVGGGLYVNRHILSGCGDAGEIGHTIIEVNGRECGCGQKGCLERYTAATGVALTAELALKQHKGNSLLSQFSPAITAKHVYDAAARGDELALSVADTTANHLGLACVQLCRLIDPQVIVLTGGLAQAGAPLFDAVNKAYLRHTWKLGSKVRIIPAQAGYETGVIGAAYFARLRFGTPAVTNTASSTTLSSQPIVSVSAVVKGAVFLVSAGLTYLFLNKRR